MGISTIRLQYRLLKSTSLSTIAMGHTYSSTMFSPDPGQRGSIDADYDSAPCSRDVECYQCTPPAADRPLSCALSQAVHNIKQTKCNKYSQEKIHHQEAPNKR